jgi:hypothetical protein
MGQPSNSTQSNKPFEKKKDLYDKSPYYINRFQIAKYEKWDDDTIKDNARWYIEKLKSYYNLKDTPR